jgi:hypothetical protein
VNEETLSSFSLPSHSSLSSTVSTTTTSPSIISTSFALPPSSTISDTLSHIPLSSSPSISSASSSSHVPTSSIISHENLLPAPSLPHRSTSTGFITAVDAVPSVDTVNSSIYQPRACFLTATAEVNNISGIVLLDTGSGVSIISSSHWHIIAAHQPVHPYHGPAIQGPDGSSIGPEGYVSVQITMAGTTIQHPVILAKYFHHLILLGNDYMKSIGLVLDLQANKMWLRTDSERTYSVSSDLTQAGRIDVPVISAERRVIAPYHIAYIQVTVPPSLSSHSWDASVTVNTS